MARPTLFDFNGVLVDDELVHFEAFRDVLAPVGIELTQSNYMDRYLGFDDIGAFRAILTDAGRDATRGAIDALVVAKKPAYLARIATGLRIFPGAVELVRRRAAQGSVAIVSGALRHEIEYCLGKMGITDLVAFVVAAEDTTACKPDPQGYNLAKARLPDAVVIEDSIAGIDAARAAGLRCVAVAHSYPIARLRDAGADAVFETIAAIDDASLDGGR